jgi:hypothetical protein
LYSWKRRLLATEFMVDCLVDVWFVQVVYAVGMGGDTWARGAVVGCIVICRGYYLCLVVGMTMEGRSST